MGRLVRRRALGLYDDVDLFPPIASRPPSEWKLIARLGVHHLVLAATDDALTPVSVHLDAQDEVEQERKRIASRHEWVVDLLRGGKQPGSAAADLGRDGKGGQLARAARAVVLRDLRELRKEGEREGAELCGGEHARRRNNEGKAYSQKGQDSGEESSSGVGCCCERSGGVVVEDDEECNEHVLNSEEKVLSIRRKREAVPRGICKGYGIGRRLQDVGG